jgi:cytochrome c oxidase subunit 2
MRATRRGASAARRHRITAASGALVALASAGCASNHSALHPAGPRAALIAELWWVFLLVAAVVYVLVVAALAAALVRAQRRPAVADPGAAGVDPRGARRLIHVALALTVVALIGLAVSDFVAGRALTAPVETPLRVRVVGHQWWWEIEYDDPEPSRRFRVANELHVPVGRPVQLELTSRDVIHSFWVPSLSGKKDLIPGRTTRELVWADAAGVFRGQCAEFCGYQHAKMGLAVYAEPQPEFDAWSERQRAAAAAPAGDVEERGREVFLAAGCPLCHTIRGTPARATTAPDLTHVASRARIAAGALPNGPGALAAWITDPQGVKPGARMPATELAGADLTALAAYLAGLE